MKNHQWTSHYPGKQGWYWIKLRGSDLIRPGHVRTGIRTSNPDGRTGYLVSCAGAILYRDDIEAFWTERLEKPLWGEQEMGD